MRVTIIHGSPRVKGNTVRATEVFKERLSSYEDIEFVEFHLANALPEFCRGCNTCFIKGEDKCPHREYVKPILEAMESSDGVVITSPVYALSESALVKNLLDHLAYIFVVHRPRPALMNSVGMVISTTVGSGTKHVIKTISRSMYYWGIRKVKGIGMSIYAVSFEEAPERKKKAFYRKANKGADQFYKMMKKRDKYRTRLIVHFMMGLMKMMHKGQDMTIDKQYYIDQGWM